MNAPRRAAGARLLELRSVTPLEGPPTRPSGLRLPPVFPVTGGGLVATVRAAGGLAALWRGEERLVEAVRLQLDGRPVPGGSEVGRGPGSWRRDIPFPGGETLRERGLLSDVVPAAVIQWTLVRGRPREEGEPGRTRTLTIELATPEEGETRRLSVPVPRSAPATVLLLPSDGDTEGALRLLKPLRARELQRAERGWESGSRGFRLLRDGSPIPLVEEALQAVRDSPIGRDGRGEPSGPFLGGVVDGAPTYLAGAPLAELGLAALAAGHHPLGRCVLEALADEAEPPPVPLLHLAARYALWTGEPAMLVPLQEALTRAARIVGGARPAAAFPSPERVLTRLLDGLEPLGPEPWITALSQQRGRPPRPSPGAVPLPVLGAEPDSAPATSPPPGLLLPPPEAFASPNSPGFGGRRTLQAARILRSWIEGRVGADPDAAYGRLRLAPGIGTGTSAYEARGIRAGDAVLTFAWRLRGNRLVFELRQEGGRVPIQLVFEPLLERVEGVDRILIGEEIAGAAIVREHEGARLRLQFPLDPERRVTVEIRR